MVLVVLRILNTSVLDFVVSVGWCVWIQGSFRVFAKLQVTASFIMCVCLSVSLSGWNNSASIGRILMKFHIWVFFKNLSRKFKFHYTPNRTTGTLHEDVWTFMISHLILVRMKNVSDKSCRENQNTHLCFVTFFF